MDWILHDKFNVFKKTTIKMEHTAAIIVILALQKPHALYISFIIGIFFTGTQQP